MKEKKYFYFANPHTFEYPFFVYLKFIRRNNHITHYRDRSKWIEVNNYTYYGEPVNCIIPARFMEYDFVFSMLNSEDRDNVFGAINYLLRHYQKKFIEQVNADMCPNVATNIIFQYFRKDIQLGYKEDRRDTGTV